MAKCKALTGSAVKGLIMCITRQSDKVAYGQKLKQSVTAEERQQSVEN